MLNLSKFAWLKDYRELEYEIAYLELNLMRTKTELKRWVQGDLAKVKLTADSQGSKVEEVIEQIEWELAHKMNNLFDIKRLVKTFEGLEHRILIGKYIEHKTLEQVAEELGYSAQYIYNKHAQIRRMVSFAENYTVNSSHNITLS